tara:strand:+ start:531 stop:1196 length:666 start_codon:yes stop_codon:yes gene_type:complete
MMNLETIDDVVMFYRHSVYEQRIIAHPDYGFVLEDGSPAFPDRLSQKATLNLQRLHSQALKIAHNHKVDVHDIIFFSEAVRVIHDCDIEFSPSDFDGAEVGDWETPKDIEQRRAHMQYKYMTLVIKQTCDNVEQSEDGLAVPAHLLQPAVRSYINRVQERMGDMMLEKQAVGSMDDVADLLKDAVIEAKAEGKMTTDISDDIDPDSDDNNDDPFGWDEGEE